MLPPGHAAAGYLTAVVLTKLFSPNLSQAELHQLYFWGAFWGFAPDLDMFAAFLKARGFTFQNSKINHRDYLSHAPVIWLVLGSAVALLAGSHTYLRWVAILVVAGSWSHFLIDTIQFGIRWKWPVSLEVVALRDKGLEFIARPNSSFLSYWIQFVRWYTTRLALSFYLELFLIAAFLYVFLSH